MFEETKNRIIEMAWEDRTPFDAIEDQFGLSEKDVIIIMRRNLSLSSFKLWRKRVSGRKTKHRKHHVKNRYRFRSKNQI
ncbi:MAG: TIGR03643 family protein [Candidatus Marinimicrobia bacterium]|nr:TIGR03643 family protein [Candidatus Neomarinimicrobiota bacterium]|tara:strand:- start:377 stop:613 length:237 start_codon:yes stop_codon:yes gene_type:complete